jgi:chromosome segregation ATPase
VAAAKKEIGALAKAASALETELSRFEVVVGESRRLTMVSEKTLHRAKSLLESCAAAERRLATELEGFAAAMRDVQGRQQACMEATVAMARRIEERVHDRAALLERFGKLGERARDVDGPIRAVTEKHAEGAAPAELLGALGEVLERIDGILGEASSLEKDARDREWDDVARAVSALEQQLRSARGNLEGAHRNVAGRAPS